MRQRRLQISALLLATVVLVSAEENALVYENNCASCHGIDGSANTPQGRKVKARDLRASKLTDAEIEQRIRAGVKSKSGTTVMPAFGNELTDAQIQEAIQTVKSFRSQAAK